MAKPSTTPSVPAADDRPAEAVALERRIVAQHAVRLHVGLILGACFGAGLVVTKVLLLAGVHAMWLRYAVALAAGYATFLLGIRLWLAWTGFGPKLEFGTRSSASGGSGNSSGGSWNIGGGRGSSSGYSGGGGGSGGGGASASFAESSGGGARSVGLVSASSSSSSSGSGGGKGGGFDLGGDGDGFVLIALIALIAAVFGAAAYLVWAAPTILSDAAFAALLSGGLVRSARKMREGGWVGSVVRDTWWPFAIVFVLALVFALTAQHYYPEAQTIRDVIRHL